MLLAKATANSARQGQLNLRNTYVCSVPAGADTQFMGSVCWGTLLRRNGNVQTLLNVLVAVCACLRNAGNVILLLELSKSSKTYVHVSCHRLAGSVRRRRRELVNSMSAVLVICSLNYLLKFLFHFYMQRLCHVSRMVE